MIPNHVAIIMDGNGRWAKEKNMPRSFGHKKGSENLEKLIEHIFKKGVKVLSVYAFSTENFKRDSKEVDFLMNLFMEVFSKKINDFKKNNIKVVFSKKESGLRKDLEELIKKVELETFNNEYIFNVCINYGSHDEIIDMAKKISKKVLNKEISIDEIDDNIINKNLYQDLPPIDLLIRTSGELRLSNFMLYQLSYSELYFTNTYFPDFNNKEFDKALLEYRKRDRRFGKVKG